MVREINKEKFEKPFEKYTMNDYLKHVLVDFKLYGKGHMGKPRQEIDIKFETGNSYILLLPFCSYCQSYYDYRNSSSFVLIKDNPKSSVMIFNQSLVQENFQFRNKFFKDLNSLIKDNNTSTANCDIKLLISKALPDLKRKSYNELRIGFAFSNFSTDDITLSFINKIKKGGLIDSYEWSMYYFNDSESVNSEYKGQFVYGRQPHEYNPERYNASNLITIKLTPKTDYTFDYGIKFDEVYFISKGIKKPEKILMSLFDFNYDFVISPTIYFSNIKKEYFDEFIAQKICFKEEINKHEVIYCDAKLFDEDKRKKFPALVFYKRDFMYNFTLDSNDLFKLIFFDKYYLFSVISYFEDPYLFPSSSDEIWSLGRLFLKKYMFTFNKDKNVIGFYNAGRKEEEERKKREEEERRRKEEEERKKREEEERRKREEEERKKREEEERKKREEEERKRREEEEKKKESTGTVKFWTIFFFSLLGIVIFCFLIFIAKKILLKNGYTLARKKKMANELNEEFNYVPAKDKKKNKNIELNDHV